jgi:glycosyltransferase involved in cell wall biosynthesis
MIPVCIVMPTYNGIGTIEKSIDSIFQKSSYKNFDVLVIDDGSTDDTESWIKKYKKSNLHYKKLKHSGICAALDFAYTLIGNKDIIRMDNDSIVMSEDWIEQFINTAYTSDNIGIVSCCPIRDNGNIHAFEVKVISGKYECVPPSCQLPHDPNIHNKIYEIEAAWLMCAYIKNNIIKSCINDLNYYPVWVEDVDYCIQARKAGFRVICNQNIKINHTSPITRIPRTSLDEAIFATNRSKEHFQKKWWSFGDFSYIKKHYKDYPEIVKFINT